jgi:hypothetical protein
MRVAYGIALFERVSDGSINLISRHPWWSLTWTFLFNIGWSSPGTRRGFRLWRVKGGQEHWGGELLWLVRFSWMRQAPMPHVMKYHQRYGGHSA